MLIVLTMSLADDVIEGRGFMSTLWGWITYPFSWWSSGEPEQPVSEPLVGPDNNIEAEKPSPDNNLEQNVNANPNEVIEIGDHNLNITCNDQTCTTIRCDKKGCTTTTCNIYDTNILGECRNYNIIPEEPQATTPKPVSTTSGKPPNIDTVGPEDVVSSTTEEHPLELETVLSSTIDKPNIDNASEDVKKEVIQEQK